MSKTSYYNKRKERYQQFLNKLEPIFKRYVSLKLTVLVTGIVLSVFFFSQRMFAAGGGIFLLGIVLLVYLDIGQRKVIKYQKLATILRDVNEHSIWRLDGRWVGFEDSGKEFQDDTHPYTSDLDIFGRGSVFQWINVTRTFLGRKKLSEILKSHPGQLTEIRERQAAIGELSQNIQWRQRFLAYGIVASDQLRDPDFLLKWVKDRNPLFLQMGVILGIRTLPVMTIGSIIGYYGGLGIPFYIPLLMIGLQIGLLKIGNKKRTATLVQAGKYEKNLQLYGNLIRHILKREYQTPCLVKLKQKLINVNQKSANEQVAKLAKIVESIDNRYNFFYVFINALSLWDYQCYIALEQWKEVSGKYLKDWLETIAEFEALASLAIIRHDHPDWAIPGFVSGTPSVVAKHLGHPLLPGEVRVNNPLQIGNQTKTLLITGSNMSGKSTYLRTVGINLVLAYCGAPVCAELFQCTLLDVYTCMRISDNLEKNISTFYAEILRIKSIVEASVKSRPILFLLDEIFKGTNSLDRHSGAKMLIKQLIQNGAVGLVSTHDLELGEMANELPTVKNFHFQEHFINNQLSFDYHLQPGISKTRNALYLMKAAGIVISEE